MSAKRVLVTGGNGGIGLALCKQLVSENGCHVYLGARSADKGAAAVKQIQDEVPAAASKIEAVVIDIVSDESVVAAAASIKEKLGSEKMYALVNNAGTGGAHGVSEETQFLTNLYGTKRVVDAFLPLLDASDGRIVSVGSGMSPLLLQSQSDETKTALTAPGTTWEQLDSFIKAERGRGGGQGFAAYQLSKAAVATLSISLAASHPNILSMTITPGFIDTAMSKRPDGTPQATKKPEEGTVSIRRCLFDDKAKLVNGAYYGSDGLRSPLTKGREPGEPEYTGTEGYA